MGSGEAQEEDGGRKGFAGLSSLVSNVGAIPMGPVEKQSGPMPDTPCAQRARPPSQTTGGRETSEEPHLRGAQASGVSSTVKWLLGSAAVFGLIWLFGESLPKSRSTAPTYYPRVQPPTATAAPSSFRMFGADGNEIDSSGKVIGQRNDPQDVQFRQFNAEGVWVDSYGRPVQSGSDFGNGFEEPPPVGRSNVLSVRQICYCLAEDIRLDAARGVVNTYIESDVRTFNAMVADYNSRCAEYRHKQGSLEAARSTVEGYRIWLQSEGESRFQRGRVADPGQVSPAGSSPEPDPIVQVVRRLLSERGYDAGKADGLAGPKTRWAIAAFQRDQGVPADGVVSSSLLRLLSSAAPSQLGAIRPEPAS